MTTLTDIKRCRLGLLLADLMHRTIMYSVCFLTKTKTDEMIKTVLSL